LNSLGVRTSIASFADVVLRGEGNGQEKKCIGEVKYQTFGYLEPNVKSMIIIVIFTHREIWVGCVLSLRYLMYKFQVLQISRNLLSKLSFTSIKKNGFIMGWLCYIIMLFYVHNHKLLAP